MKKLFVYYSNKLIGVLSQDQNLIFSFEYEESWQQDSQAFPLSLAMPLSNKKYDNKVSLSYFENILPEDQVRDDVEKITKTSGIYNLLAEFGSDCAGAVQIFPQKQRQKQKTKVVDKDSAAYYEIPLAAIDKAIEHHKSIVQVLSKTHQGYLSLAGAQDKFPIIFKDNKFLISKKNEPTTHIVKLPIWRQGIKESVFNEYYCMQLASRVGLVTPHCFIFSGKYPLYIIERYDRKASNVRIHQQDFCQAHGILSESKYEANGGPSLKQNYELIVNNIPAQKRFLSAEAYLRWIAFNLIIGNNDNHSKNISFLLNPKLELAPFYDLLCTSIYPLLSKDFAFKIGEQNRPEKIGKKEFELLEDEIEVKRGVFFQIFAEMTDLVIAEKDKLASQMHDSFTNCNIPKRIAQLIDKRIKGYRIRKAL